MKLTHKELASPSNYSVSAFGRNFFWWNVLAPNVQSEDSFATEQEAYEDCCRVCGLVEDEE